jgi:hypothetical protein
MINQKIGVLRTKAEIQGENEYVVPFVLIGNNNLYQLNSLGLTLTKSELQEALKVTLYLLTEDK